MPKSSRAVAQRYAAASRKRRKSERQQPPAPAEARPAESLPSQPSAAPTPAAASPGPTSRPRPVPRRVPIDYSAQYSYVWTDLKRIAVITGGLLLGLVGLTYVIH